MFHYGLSPEIIIIIIKLQQVRICHGYCGVHCGVVGLLLSSQLQFISFQTVFKV